MEGLQLFDGECDNAADTGIKLLSHLLQGIYAWLGAVRIKCLTAPLLFRKKKGNYNEAAIGNELNFQY